MKSMVALSKEYYAIICLPRSSDRRDSIILSILKDEWFDTVKQHSDRLV
jgi:hypothetical protein